ncbi:MAG TPA: type II toxin-antitoxin system VapC family toxin [Candidatus Acetothermia bacterium]|nr:type II toxin-antitoxin system VapC family toxin [Candidatus Acetothermia bacterium]
MKLSLDTNIFLEVILDQERANEARTLLSEVEGHEFFISDYSLHSIGLLLFRRGKHEVFRQFLEDMVLGVGVAVITLSAQEMESLIEAAQRFGLDFDDAYQYAVAERYGLTIVSFDSDFDRTERGRKTPEDLLEL